MTEDLTPITPESVPPEYDPDWQRYDENSAGVVIKVPDVGTATGTLTDYGEARPRELYVDLFQSDRPGEGAGKRLLGYLKQEGLQYGAQIMSGHFTSPAALGAFLSVAEGSPVQFSMHYSGEPVNITPDEAMQNPGLYNAATPIYNEPTSLEEAA